MLMQNQIKTITNIHRTEDMLQKETLCSMFFVISAILVSISETKLQFPVFQGPAG